MGKPPAACGYAKWGCLPSTMCIASAVVSLFAYVGPSVIPAAGGGKGKPIRPNGQSHWFECVARTHGEKMRHSLLLIERWFPCLGTLFLADPHVEVIAWDATTRHCGCLWLKPGCSVE